VGGAAPWRNQRRRGLVTFDGCKGQAKKAKKQRCTGGTFDLLRARVYIYKKRERGHNEKKLQKVVKKFAGIG